MTINYFDLVVFHEFENIRWRFHSFNKFKLKWKLLSKSLAYFWEIVAYFKSDLAYWVIWINIIIWEFKRALLRKLCFWFRNTFDMKFEYNNSCNKNQSRLCSEESFGKGRKSLWFWKLSNPSFTVNRSQTWIFM